MKINYYDLVIVGSGPAGLIAAIESHHPSKKIVILEKMPRAALKLRISGKGRCNITNDAGLSEFISHFGKNGKFLKYAFHRFFNKDLLAYFENMGITFKLERGGRYFPEGDKAIEIVNVLLQKVKSLQIPLLTNSAVTDIRLSDGTHFLLTVHDHLNSGLAKRCKQIKANKILIACGGKSYPKTGSDGQGYQLISALGHTITPVFPSLVPLITKGNLAKNLQGLSLKNVTVKIWCENKKADERFGEMLFTDKGLSGPIILAISRTVVFLLRERKKVLLTIDLKPALEIQKIDEKLLREINEHGKQNLTNLLKKLLPQKMIPVFLEILNIPGDQKLSQISAEVRKKLKILLKEFRMEISGHGLYDEAIITAGGVMVSEIDPQTMQSKLIHGLYFAGEVIDIDADTGGYNLQAAFSTGWVAGRAIKESLE
jgi:predicted Rossmann fold flavoprotein